ncbi:MAG: lysine--tRNA ligase [Candidatus Levyibacteriota bacterium]
MYYNQFEYMFWADKVTKEIISSGNHKHYWVDDMFTPSGYATVGSLRGPLIHDILFRSIKDAGKEVKWTYIFNDFDPIDGLPQDLSSFEKYLGIPLRSAPSPEKGYSSFADYFAKDFQKVLRDLGVSAQFLSSWDMYHQGKFNEVVRIALDNADKIQDIYQKVSGSKKKEKGWLPLQVICQHCGKIGTTRVYKWDGREVSYICEPEMVKWAKGCGYSGKISPFDGNGKLPWKVDWPAHWKVLGVTIEGAGKDHSSAGGSRDIAKELCKEIFNYPNPFNLPYEFFLIGGKKMGTSKGLGLKARELTDLLPPEIARFLFAKTDYKKAIEFNPVGTLAIPNLLDEYQKAAEAYFNKGDNDLARTFELSQIDKFKKPPKIRFSVLAQWIQMPNMEDVIKKKGLQEWAKYARIWVEKFAPESEKFSVSKTIPKTAKSLSDKQKKFLEKVSLELDKKWTAQDFQKNLYELAKELEVSSKEAFSAIYLSLIGKDHGPKAGWLILSLDKKFVQKRFKDIYLNDIYHLSSDEKKDSLKIFNNLKVFSISKELKNRFPSISIGIAIIKGVSIEKSNEGLEKEKEELLSSLNGLTTEKLGQYPEIISYRRLYKEMKVDWHSRRPSPEALLRRVALNKGLYNINTCVDAYNLIVMKHHISVGAFDLDKIEFPTVLRFAKNDEEILLLGDAKPTVYRETEIAYFDKIGGYNMDFNYRDAKRTAVEVKTKNLYINVDGVYDIAPFMVEKVLQEACNIIIKYCGGKIDLFGVETA